MYLINKKDVLDLAKELQKQYEVYGPFIEKETKEVFFDKIDNISDISLTAPIPTIPPKHVIMPHFEKIMSYQYNRDSKAVNIDYEVAVKPKAFFGMRPCDLEGVKCLDRFLVGQEFVDDIYLTHRKKTFIVTNTCIAPFKQCLCSCMDSGPAAKEGYDINLTEIGDNYLVEAGSPAGEELVKKLSLKKADAKDAEAKKKTIDKSLDLFTNEATENKAWISRVMNRITTGFIKEEVWEFIGNQCFECGACTFVCPSCSCFNIEDVNTPNKTERFRTWDSCSYEGYTRMAGDHNPRKPIEDRRNKRFFCKLSYSQSKKYLRPGCVGCGRCAWVCPGEIGLPNVVTYVRREITE